jgi:hypothetical protein
MLDGLSSGSMSSGSEELEDGREEESNVGLEEKEQSTQETGNKSQDGEVGSDSEKFENEPRGKEPDFELREIEQSRRVIESESEDEEVGGASLADPECL